MWFCQVTCQDPRAQIFTGQPQHCAVDWQFDGDNILYLVRISYDVANNCHDDTGSLSVDRLPFASGAGESLKSRGGSVVGLCLWSCSSSPTIAAFLHLCASSKFSSL